MSTSSRYVLGQLAAAFTASLEHADPGARTRAGGKAQDWVKVFRGMMSGRLRIGSRTPVADAPAWATPKVVQGGFVTGDLLAGGPLLPHEQHLLEWLTANRPARAGAGPDAASRSRLHAYYLSEEGMAHLQQMVNTGCYRIDIPEESALPVIAWLLAHNQVEAARGLLSEIGPYLDRLRFYPIPDERPLRGTSLVHLQTVGQVVKDLGVLRVPQRLQAQREATLVWAPLTDRASELFLETLQGPAPSLHAGPEASPQGSAGSGSFVEGGWPCQHYPEGWRARAQALLDDYRRLRQEHRLCRKPERKGENFALMRGYLEACVADPSRLTGRDVGMIRRVLADINTRRGLPASQRCLHLRQFQVSLARRPAVAELAQVVIGRLAELPPDEGLESLDEALAPVTVAEARAHSLEMADGLETGDGVELGAPLAGRLAAKVRRCQSAPVEALVEENVISSAEVLAVVLPQITAQVRAAGLDDPDLRRLYGATYQAFRRRRSLLLLNLESQVKFHELPWVRAMDAQRREDQANPEEQGSLEEQSRVGAARGTLERAVVLSVTSFPHQILPNKLLQEIRALATDAGLTIPLVEEVAADIFMGAFTEKFLRAAQAAGTLLEGTLYERYYGVSYARVRQIDDVRPVKGGGTPTSPAFFQLCSELAGPVSGGSSVARNGMIIEQEQILTTHNLAVLFSTLGLTDTLRPRLEELARRNLAWICRRQQQVAPGWKARLQMLKNTAYAWRQMIFFLSLAAPSQVEAFLVWAAEHLDAQHHDFRARFRPALDGLARAARGLPPEETKDEAGDTERPARPRRFLGWTTGSHWLLRQDAEIKP